MPLAITSLRSYLVTNYPYFNYALLAIYINNSCYRMPRYSMLIRPLYELQACKKSRFFHAALLDNLGSFPSYYFFNNRNL